MAADPRQEIVSTGQYLLSHQLAWGSTGNISARFDDNSFFISASGASLGTLTTENLSLCRVNGETVTHNVTPSKEHRVHAAVYLNDPKARAVIHTSPPYVSLIAAAKNYGDFVVEHFIEAAVMLQKIAWIPFMLPGSPEIIEAVGNAAKGSDVLMMQNHGIMVTGENMRKALNKVDTMEFLCRMVITAKSAGIDLRAISKDELEMLMNDSRARNLNYGS